MFPFTDPPIITFNAIAFDIELVGFFDRAPIRKTGH